MKKTWFIALLFTLFIAGIASAQTTGSGSLTVTATVQGSLSLVFNNSTGGLPALLNAGTSAATLAFGSISAYNGTYPSNGISRTTGTSSFTMGAPFQVTVTKANVTSSNYALTANANDTTYGWAIGSTDITAGGTVGSTISYGNSGNLNLYLTVPFTASAGSISNAINFTATAN